jgi:hypothetical protein
MEFTDYITISSMTNLLGMWYRKYDKRRLYLLGLNNKEIRECSKVIKSSYLIYKKCLENPFMLYPIPMNKCMEITNRIRRKPKPEDIKCGEIVRKMYEYLTFRGWSATPIRTLEKHFTNLMDYRKRLLSEFEVKEEFQCFYLNYPYAIESYITRYLTKLIKSDSIKDSDPFVELSEYNGYNRLEADFRCSSTLSPDQKAAIQGALDHKVSVITGAAGTGKSTTIREIIYNLEQRDISYAVCAYTGKAVARFREVLDSNVPMTLHLRIKKSKNITFKHLIIDEASMVTLELFYKFVMCFNFPFSLTLVGDPNQLPPIGWGSFFSQLIESQTVPVYELFVNHRVYEVEDEKDGIVYNTKRMIEYGKGLSGGSLRMLKPMKFEQTANFIIKEGGLEQITAFATAFHKQGINPYELTIITPYNKDIELLNKSLQELYFGSNECVYDSRGKQWYVGDRVMMIKNDYKINVMNGEEGKISEIDATQVKVKFGAGREYQFPLEPDPKKKNYGWSQEKGSKHDSDDEDELTEKRTVKILIHSYAISCHRGQGSEWNYVIVYLPHDRTNFSFINKNLIYTALTRAKRALFFIGNISELEASTTRNLPYRCEHLSKRLLDRLPIIEVPSLPTEGAPLSDEEWNGCYEDDDIPFDGY